MKCKRCGGSRGGPADSSSPRLEEDSCLCGNHSFELGKLMSAVGCYLHGFSAIENLRASYRSLATKCAGQHCNGCDVCPTVAPAVSS